MHVRLKGVHRVERKLRDGGVRVHYYAWRGGPKINAEPGSPEFLAAYAAAQAGRRTSSGETVKALIADFEASSEYRRLAESTRRDYARYLGKVEHEFGDMPLAALSDKRARGIFLEWRDGLSSSPRTADYAWGVLARLFAWGRDRGKVSVNPCERGGRLYRSDRSDRIWTDHQIAAFNEVASQPLRDALLLALWTGQREGDLLRLGWTSYDGTWITLRQNKTGRRVRIPVAVKLRARLDVMRVGASATTVLTNTRGQPWTEDGFRASWGTASRAAGIVDLHFHDLRGSAVSRLADAGATEAEIASITGHSLGRVSHILDGYLHRSERLAQNAMAKLEKNQRRSKL